MGHTSCLSGRCGSPCSYGCVRTGNQFRALEEDEVLFLDSVLEKQREEERLRKEMEGEELKHFREYV